jgi:RNA polymerase sigma-70 factor (ECF subfamily)
MNADRDLIRRAQSGDQEAFAQIVQDHQTMVYRLALAKTQRHHDAEEITQTVFLKAWQGLPAFRGEAALSTWLYRLTLNSCTDFFRQSHPEPLSLDDLGSPARTPVQPSPEEDFLWQEKQAALLQAIHRLPEQSREILVLREFDGRSYEELSQILGIPVGTVRSRLARARLALRKDLLAQGNFFAPPPSNPAEGIPDPGKGGKKP